jgi:hypothetical protein
VVILVDYSGDAGFSADESQVGHVPGGLRLYVRGPLLPELTGPWTARLIRVGPLAGDQTAVPGQQRFRRDQSAAPQPGWQQPGKSRQDGPVGPVRLGPGRPGGAGPSPHAAAPGSPRPSTPRPSRTSQPNTRTMIKYSRRTDTDRDLAPTRLPSQIPAQGPCTELWIGTLDHGLTA